jgi:hypothetical protein
MADDTADDIAPEARAWIDAFAARIDVPPPTDDDIRRILGLASSAAHGSVRQSAPVACWMAGRAGFDLIEATRLADG